MARKAEPGISYYRMNCGHSLNKKVRLLFNEFDSNGYWIWQCLLDHAYDHRGYYFDCNNEDELELFATDICKKPVTLVKEVVAGCIKRGLFDKVVYDKYRILTSVMMQEIYVDATKERRRKGTSIELLSDFLLITMSESDNGILVVPRKNDDVPRKLEEIPRQNPHSIVKDSIVEKSKGDNEGAKAPRAKKVFIPPDIAETRKYFLSVLGNPQNPNCWPEDKCRMQADLFWNHYEANGWIQNKGKPIKIWKSAAAGWIIRAIQGIYESGNKTTENGKHVHKNGTTVQKIDKTVTNIDKVASEINFLYSRFCEDPAYCTIISVETVHYDYLKRNGRISFPEDRTAEIFHLATTTLQEKELENNQLNMKMYMKKIGVIEFFKDLKKTGAEAVFIGN